MLFSAEPVYPRAYPRLRRDLRRTYTNHCEPGQVKVMPMAWVYFEPLRTNTNHSERACRRALPPPIGSFVVLRCHSPHATKLLILADNCFILASGHVRRPSP